MIDDNTECDEAEETEWTLGHECQAHRKQERKWKIIRSERMVFWKKHLDIMLGKI